MFVMLGALAGVAVQRQRVEVGEVREALDLEVAGLVSRRVSEQEG